MENETTGKRTQPGAPSPREPVAPPLVALRGALTELQTANAARDPDRSSQGARDVQYLLGGAREDARQRGEEADVDDAERDAAPHLAAAFQLTPAALDALRSGDNSHLKREVAAWRGESEPAEATASQQLGARALAIGDDVAADDSASRRAARTNVPLAKQTRAGKVDDGPSRGTDRKPPSAETVAPNKDGKPKRPPAKDSKAFDAERLVGLLLGRAHDQAESALNEKGKGRWRQILVAAENMTAYLREITEIAKTSPIDWTKHARDLGAVKASVERLDMVLMQEAPGVSIQLVSAFGNMADLVPESGWVTNTPGGKAQPAAPTSERDSIETSRQAIGVVREHLKHPPTFDPKGDVRAQAVAFCEPLELPLRIAGEAALSVQDRTARLVLKPDVEALSAAMDRLAEIIGMNPKLPWDRTFAAVFDAENAVRGNIGLIARARPYSGKIDPKAALEMVENAADKGPSSAVPAPTDPTSAYASVKILLTYIFANQRKAIERASENLRERDKNTSVLDAILALAANAAIAGAIGGLGSLASMWGKNALEANAVSSRIPARILDTLDKEEKGIVTKQILDVSQGFRTVAADVIKDGVKDMFKSAVKIAQDHKVEKLGSDSLKNFATIQGEKIDHAALQTELLAAGLKPAIEQASMEDLTALVGTLSAVNDRAFHEQYDHSMREWQNAKAQADAGPAPFRMGEAAPPKRDVDLREQHVKGVLEVKLLLQQDGEPFLMSLRLFDAEPAARVHFEAENIRLADLGMNQRYEVELQGSQFSQKIVFGVGPDRGLMLESLGSRDLMLLKILVAGDPMSSANVQRGMMGQYNHISDQAARSKAMSIATVASLRYKTGRLER